MNITINGDIYIMNDGVEQEGFNSDLTNKSLINFEFDEDFINACNDYKSNNIGLPDELKFEFPEYVELLERCGSVDKEDIFDLVDLIDIYSEPSEDFSCIDCIREELLDMLHGFLDIISK